MTGIKNLEDVSAFMELLVKEGVNAHPDEDFRNYVSMETGEETYSAADADDRNKLMAHCFKVCEATGTDIYSFYAGDFPESDRDG